MAIGSVKYFNVAKRYGFIQAQNGEELFFHSDSVTPPGTLPRLGEEVEYVRDESPTKGPRAALVRLKRSVLTRGTKSTSTPRTTGLNGTIAPAEATGLDELVRRRVSGQADDPAMESEEIEELDKIGRA